MAVETSSESGEPLLGETIRDKEKQENIRSEWDPNDFALRRVGMGNSGHVGRSALLVPQTTGLTYTGEGCGVLGGQGERP